MRKTFYVTLTYNGNSVCWSTIASTETENKIVENLLEGLNDDGENVIIESVVIANTQE